MKKLTVCFTLTLLLTLSAYTSSNDLLSIQLYGKAINKNPQTKFYLTITGIKDSIKIPNNNSDTVYVSITIKDSILPNISLDSILLRNTFRCTLSSISIEKKGYLIDTSYFKLKTSFISNLPPSLPAILVTEKCPTITDLSYSNNLLQWKHSDSVVVDSQFILIKHKNSTLDSSISLNVTQKTYQLTPSTNIGDTITIKLITLNADSSDTSTCYIPPTSTAVKNKITDNLVPQKTASEIYNAQGRLFRGIDSRSPKFFAGAYFSANKAQLLLH